MRIMVVDDDEGSLQSVCHVLRDIGHEPHPFSDSGLALAKAAEEFFPLIITDIRMPGLDGLELLSQIKALPGRPRSDVVLITGHGDQKTAIEALRKGAYDYLNKPISAQELSAVADRSAEHQDLRFENAALRDRTEEMAVQLAQARHLLREVKGVGQIVAQSSAMRRLVREALIMHENPSVPVLIEGETGTGKEVLARLIHYGAGVRDDPFIGINCAAIPADLFESELFGHEPGAYTGSRTSGAPGKLEAAAGGSLFLDEVGELPLLLQPKLLRVLEEKAFYRLGGVKARAFDARVICASNRDLDAMVEQGLFRRDLYHRLRVGHLLIPPLRERTEDLREIADLCLRRESERKRKRFREFSPDALVLLLRYSWPGNVRELENAIERAVLLHDGESLAAAQFSFLAVDSRPDVDAAADAPRQAPGISEGMDLPEQPFDLENLVDRIIVATVNRFHGNKTQAAQFLGMSRFALHRRLQKLE